MTFENYVKARLMTYAIEEAAHLGGTMNMLAVAQVIANRVKAGWNGGDWLAVLDNASASSAYKDEPHMRGGIRLNPRDTAFRQLLQKIDDVYHGIAVDDTEGALYFAELNRIDRPWFLNNISRNQLEHPRVATVGMVSFFE